MFQVFVVLGLVITGYQVFLKKKPFRESLLRNTLVFVVGLSGFYAFAGHYFLSDMVAESIGWPKGNPFQQEVGFANLAFGVLGVLCLWRSIEFRIATAIGYSIFLLGAAITHLDDIGASNNMAEGNAGFILYFDILLPFVLLVLSFLEFMRSNVKAIKP